MASLCCWLPPHTPAQCCTPRFLAFPLKESRSGRFWARGEVQIAYTRHQYWSHRHYQTGAARRWADPVAAAVLSRTRSWWNYSAFTEDRRHIRAGTNCATDGRTIWIWKWHRWSNLAITARLKPDYVTLVPEKREEVTAEGDEYHRWIGRLQARC